MNWLAFEKNEIFQKHGLIIVKCGLKLLFQFVCGSIFFDKHFRALALAKPTSPGSFNLRTMC